MLTAPALAAYLRIDSTVHQLGDTRILRGQRLADSLPVVVKLVPQGSAGAARLAHEMKMLSLVWRSDTPYLPRPYELLELDDQLALVTEDLGGTSLARLQSERPWTLPDVLEVGVLAANALDLLHQRRVVHKDINPGNIIFSPATRQLQLIDLGHASELTYEKQQLANLEGTPTFMSPEQTGRTQHALDYRTDLYSLGASLYALLAGRPPFDSRDMADLFYGILAQAPPPLSTFNAQVPPAVEAIVARLMAKSPEERYQSAHGVAEDLAICREQLHKGLPLDVLELGRHDKIGRLELPQRIYGREADVAALLAELHACSETGQTHLVLLGGAPGIGKSSLLQALQPALLRERGLYLNGKHDELQRHVPFSAVAQAISSVVAQLLKEPEDILQLWVRRLRAALGTIGQAIVELVPDLELLVGKQRVLPELGPREAENRLLAAVQGLMRALSSKQPVVLFLDDLQWSDSSTLRVLQLLTETPQPGSQLLIVGAFRSADVDAAHPLNDVVRAIEAAGNRYTRIELAPLTAGDFQRLLADALRTQPESSELQELAAWLHNKTGGNAFFLRELLTHFWEQRLITFDTSTHAFTWDLQGLQQAAVPDQVVELLATKIATLSADEAQLLRIAACMGDTCSLDELQQLSDHAPAKTLQLLQAPIRMGLLLPLSGAYRYASAATQEAILFQFAHDRVRQAAYEGVAHEAAVAIHLRFGSLLLRQYEAGQINVFAVLQQMNAGVSGLVDPVLRRRVAELNIQGATEAHQSAAHSTALNCLEVAVKLLPEDLHAVDYALFARVQAELANNEYLSGHYDEALTRLDALVRRGGDGRILARFHESRARIFVSRARFDDAIKAAMAGMASLGYGADLHSRGTLVRGLGELLLRMHFTPFDKLANAKECTDAEVAVAMGLLGLVVEAAYHTSPATLLAVAVQICLLTLKHGVTVNSAFGYGAASTIFAIISQYPRAQQLSRLAQVLAERPGVVNQAGVIFSCGAWTNHLLISPAEMTTRHTEGYAVGRDNGDTVYATWNACSVVGMSSYVSLAQCEIYCESHEAFVRQRGNSLQKVFFAAYRQSVRCLLGRTQGPLSFSDSDFDEAVEWPQGGELLEPWQLRYILMRQFMVASLHGSAAEAAAPLRRLVKLGFTRSLSDSGVVTTCFYGALVLLANARKQGKARLNAEDRAMLKSMLAKLRKAEAASNAHGKGPWALVNAELAAHQGKAEAALVWYTQALDQLHRAGWADRLALAQECTGRFHMRQGRQALGRSLLEEARRTYAAWGAKVKAELLWSELNGATAAEDITALPSNRSVRTNTVQDTVTLTQSSRVTQIEVNSLAQASQEMFEDNQPTSLLEHACKNIMRLAGATRVVFIMGQGQKLEPVADTTEVPQQLPHAFLNFVQRVKKSIIVRDMADSDYAEPYFAHTDARVVAGIPLVRDNQVQAIVYLENSVTNSTFAPEQLVLLNILAAQAMMATQSMYLQTHLEEEIALRTREMQQAHQALLTRERESTEVQMAGGFAHEMRNALSGARMPLEALFPIDQRVAGQTVFDDLSRSVIQLTEGLKTTPLEPTLQAAWTDTLRQMQDSLDLMLSMVEGIAVGLQRGLGITRQTLEYAQVGQLVSSDESIDLTKLVRSVLEASERTLQEHQVATQIDMPAGLQLAMKEEHAYAILNNLVVNAAYAMAHLPTGARKLSITAVHTDQGTAVRVRDSGVGMSEETQKQVFRPFFTTKGVDGTGLGLGLSRKLARVYGGDLSFVSREAEGTTFTLNLPNAPSSRPGGPRDA